MIRYILANAVILASSSALAQGMATGGLRSIGGSKNEHAKQAINTASLAFRSWPALAMLKKLGLIASRPICKVKRMASIIAWPPCLPKIKNAPVTSLDIATPLSLAGSSNRPLKKSVLYTMSI